MAFESLANPLERLTTLPTTMNIRTSPTTNSTVWDATLQYFYGDVVTSGVDGYMYVYTGGVSVAPTSIAIRGGGDPSLNSAWIRVTGSGVPDYTIVTGVTGTGAAGTITFNAAGTFTVDEDTDWLVTVQGVLTGSAPLAADNFATLTLTPSVGTAVSVNISPYIGSTTTAFSNTFAVSAGTGATSIALTGAYDAGAGVISQNFAGSLTFVRLF